MIRIRIWRWIAELNTRIVPDINGTRIDRIVDVQKNYTWLNDKNKWTLDKDNNWMVTTGFNHTLYKINALRQERLQTIQCTCWDISLAIRIITESLVRKWTAHAHRHEETQFRWQDRRNKYIRDTIWTIRTRRIPCRRIWNVTGCRSLIDCRWPSFLDKCEIGSNNHRNSSCCGNDLSGRPWTPPIRQNNSIGNVSCSTVPLLCSCDGPRCGCNPLVHLQPRGLYEHRTRHPKRWEGFLFLGSWQVPKTW